MQNHPHLSVVLYRLSGMYYTVGVWCVMNDCCMRNCRVFVSTYVLSQPYHPNKFVVWMFWQDCFPSCVLCVRKGMTTHICMSDAVKSSELVLCTTHVRTTPRDGVMCTRRFPQAARLTCYKQKMLISFLASNCRSFEKWALCPNDKTRYLRPHFFNGQCFILEMPSGRKTAGLSTCLAFPHVRAICPDACSR